MAVRVISFNFLSSKKGHAAEAKKKNSLAYPIECQTVIADLLFFYGRRQWHLFAEIVFAGVNNGAYDRHNSQRKAKNGKNIVRNIVR